MNSDIVLRESKKLVSSIYDALFETLKKVCDSRTIEITKKEPELIVREEAFEVQNVGLLRFKTSKEIGTYALGFSDASSFELWKSLFPQPTATPEAPVKSLEFELLKSLFMALEPGLKSQGYAVDPKSAMIQEASALGKWSKIQVKESIKFPITTPQGDLLLEIPIFSTEYVRNLTVNYYGFKETARILVVDDSMVARKSARSCLAMAGYFNIEEVPDGQAAINKVLGSRPAFELVIADWHMPVMSGFELLKKIRAIDEYKSLPIIMVTGEKNKEEVVSAIREGVSAYLVKPVVPESFLKAISKAGGRG